MDGKSDNEGRVEIYHNEEWGTICDDSFDRDNNGARVVCRMLGYDEGVLIPSGDISDGKGIIWLDEVSCTGDENKIIDCNHYGFGTNNCGHGEDVGVKCYYLLDQIQQYLSNITHNFEKILHKKIKYMSQDIEKITNIHASLNVLIQKSRRVKQNVEDTIFPKEQKYKSWNLNQILNWISKLESERFDKYIDSLRDGFQSDGIDKGEYLPKITAANLREKPFEIMNLMDRNDLVTYFQSLANGGSHTILKQEI